MCHHNVACHEVGSDVSILTPHTCRRYVAGCRWKSFPIDQTSEGCEFPKASSGQQLGGPPPKSPPPGWPSFAFAPLAQVGSQGATASWARGRRQAGQVPEALPSLTLLKQILCEGPFPIPSSLILAVSHFGQSRRHIFLVAGSRAREVRR